MDLTRTRLDPTFPICWEDPDTLRVGFERPIARLRSPSAGVQRFVGALRRGIDPDRLPLEAGRAGTSVAEARVALTELRAALVRPGDGSTAGAGFPAPQHPSTAARIDAPRPLRTVIADEDQPVPRLREALAAARVCRPHPSGASDGRIRTEDPAEDRPEFVVFVERYWSPLARAQRWLMDDVPHLLMRFTDGEVHVGPLVVAGGAPCHTCISLERVERDRATGVLAAQLAGTPASSEQPGAVMLAAAFAAEYVAAWLAGEAWASTSRVVLPVAMGLHGVIPETQPVQAHPDCACAQLGGLSAPPRSCPPRQ